MEWVTYQDLVTRFGNLMAFDLLITIEKLARLYGNGNYYMDEDARLQKALSTLNGIDFTKTVSLEGIA